MSTFEPITHVGYVGLGIMGGAMAANLIKAGFDTTVWNRTASKTAPLIEQGAHHAPSLAALAQSSVQVICLNVTDSADVEAVVLGNSGLLAHAKPGLILIDHSTISPITTQAIASQCAAKGVHFLDAPVSGGDIGARNATLSIMVGGEEAIFQRCLPMFEAMGKNITHLGQSGMGQVCKACNQVAVSLNLLGVCEAMALAKKSGLDLEKMIQVVSGGAGGSWQLANLGPRIAQGDMWPGFMIDLVLKDLAIVIQAADKLDLPLAGTLLAEQSFRASASQSPDAGKQGTQAMSRTLEMLGGFTYK